MWAGLLIWVVGWTASPAKAEQVWMAHVHKGVVEVALPGELPNWQEMPWDRDSSRSNSEWSSPVRAQSAQGVRVGDRIALYRVKDGRSSGSCRVVSFVTRVLGFDDFGDPKSPIPTCGTAQVQAQLDCGGKAEGMYLAMPEGTKLDAYSKVSEHGRTPERAARDALVGPKVSEDLKELHRDGEAPEKPIKTTYRKVSLARHSGLSVIDTHWFTGEPVIECGGGDFSQRRWALWDGRALVGPTRRWEARPTAVFSAGSKVFVLRAVDFSGWVIEDLDGETVYQFHEGICACAC